MSSVMPAPSCFVPASPADSGPSPQPTPAELFRSLPRCRRSTGRDPIKRQMQRALAALFGDGDQEHGTKRPEGPRYAVLVLHEGMTRIAKQPCPLVDAMAFIRAFRGTAKSRGRKIVLAKLVERNRKERRGSR